MFLAGSRFIFFLAFAVGALVLGATFYLEYGPGLKPCWLCQVQRFFLLGFCFVNLMAYAHAPKRVGLWCYSLASSLFALGGAASAGIVMGLSVPMALTSRSDDANSRLASAALLRVVAKG